MKPLARVVVYQGLSISADESIESVSIPVDAPYPKVILRAAHATESDQRNFGGTHIAVDFEPGEDDILRIASEGFAIALDFLTAISVTTGIQLGESGIVEAVGPQNESGYRPLAGFIPLEERRWPRSLDSVSIRRARALAAHWEKTGAKRLRRGARLYAQALGFGDPIDAFAAAYSGLEALEPPLAQEAGLTPGSETVEGKCDKCGATYPYKKTALVGVRAFVLERIGEDQGRAAWKELSRLRHDIVHSLEDRDNTEGKARELLPDVLHLLHEALMHLSHQHDEENKPYTLPKTIKPILLSSIKVEFGDLREWRGPFLDIRELRWVPHETFGYVPEFDAFNAGYDFGELRIGYLTKHLREATIADVEELLFEEGPRG